MIALWFLWIGLAVGGLAISRHFMRDAIGIENDNTSNRTRIVYLPGILADGVQSSRPLIDTWLRHGSVTRISYSGTRFRAGSTARELAAYIQKWIISGGCDKIVFIGSSMGGILALDIIEKLDLESTKVNVIFVDTPAGSKTLLGGGNIAGPVLCFIPVGVLTNLLTSLWHKLFVPPKEDDIQEDIKQDPTKKAELIESALAGMRHFKISIWRDQIVYMTRHKLHSEVFKKIDQAVYLSCTRNNETVKQPAASEIFKQIAGSKLEVFEVETPHAAYAQQPKIWNDVMDEQLTVVVG